MAKNTRIPAYVTLIVAFFFAAGPAAEARVIQAPREADEEWEMPKKVRKTMAVDPVWEGVRGRMTDLSEPLTLTRLVDIALSNNPSTRQAWEEARAQDAAATQSNSAWYPKGTLKFNSDYQRTVANKRIDTLNQFAYGPGAEVTWLLLDFGGRSGSDMEARQTLLASNFLFNQSIQDVLLDTEKAYYDLYSARSSVEAAKSDVEDANATYIAAQEKFNVGLVTRLDVLQAKSSYENAQFNLEDARANLEDARANLANVIGLPADTPFDIVEPEGEIPSGMTGGDVTVMIEEALKKRPDIAAARADLKAKEGAVKAANSDLWPTLTASGSADYNWYHDYGSLKRTVSIYNVHIKEDYTYGGGLQASWDIFDGFDNLFKKRQAQREMAAERQKLIQAELEASADVWSKYYSLKTSEKKYVFSEAFLDSAKESHELASEGYKAGLKSILDLLQSQSQLSQARSKYISARNDLFVSLVELLHATGSLHVRERQGG